MRERGESIPEECEDGKCIFEKGFGRLATNPKGSDL